MNSESIDLKRSFFYPKTDLVLAHEQCVQLSTLKDELCSRYSEEVKSIAEEFFKRSGAIITPLNQHGTFHLIYKVCFSEHERSIIKIMLPGLPLPQSSLLIDQWIYQLLKEQGLPSLLVHNVDLSLSTSPFAYEIMEFASGQTLSLLQDPESQQLPNGLLSALGAIIAQIHSIQLHGFGPLSAREYKNNIIVQGVHSYWSDYIFCHLQKHIEICTNIGAITFTEVEQINYLFMKYAKLFDCHQGVLLHGDLGGHNIFSDGGKITALIDWEDAMSGDPVFDIAYWGTFTRDHFRAELLNGYKKHACLPHDFEIRYWLYYLRIALSKTVHRYKFGIAEKPNKPAASTRIQKALMYLHNLGE